MDVFCMKTQITFYSCTQNYQPKLKASSVAMELCVNVRKIRFPRGNNHLKSQLFRAADSILLNIEEGYGRTKGNRKIHYESAYGSVREVKAILVLLDNLGVNINNCYEITHYLGGLCYGLKNKYI
jgi:four helix bundle protein